MDLISNIENSSLKESVPSFEVGDTVAVEVRIKEGEKERIQTFQGVIIAIKGAGVQKTFTVRRIVQGEGVERVFPVHSPKVAGISVLRHGRVRRAKLYYLRGRTGKAARIAERRVMTESTAKKKKKVARKGKARKAARAAEAAAGKAAEPQAETKTAAEDKAPA